MFLREAPEGEGGDVSKTLFSVVFFQLNKVWDPKSGFIATCLLAGQRDFQTNRRTAPPPTPRGGQGLNTQKGWWENQIRGGRLPRRYQKVLNPRRSDRCPVLESLNKNTCRNTPMIYEVFIVNSLKNVTYFSFCEKQNRGGTFHSDIMWLHAGSESRAEGEAWRVRKITLQDRKWCRSANVFWSRDSRCWWRAESSRVRRRKKGGKFPLNLQRFFTFMFRRRKSQNNNIITKQNNFLLVHHFTSHKSGPFFL